MLKARFAAVALWLPIHLAVIIWGRPYHVLLYLEVIALLATVEMFDLLAAAGRRPHRLATLVAGGLYLGTIAYRPAVAFGAAAALTLATLVVPLARRTPAGVMGDAGASVLAFAYVPFLLGFVMLTRLLPGGVQLLLLFFFTVWADDIAAYTVGRLFGRRPLAPLVSPGKTAEGAVAGAVAALIAASLLVAFAFPGLGLGWFGGLLVGGAVAVGVLAGDLAESAFKRDAGVKDTGRLLWGHGGVLDRFDVILFCAPLFYGAVSWARAVR
jgi:phosphatidate cytidylyltransferase